MFSGKSAAPVSPSLETPANSRLAGIDALRVLAAFMVVCVHDVPFSHPAYELGSFRPSDVILALCRAAVPFFFIASGYFLARSLKSPDQAWPTLARQSKRLLFLFLAWSLIYLIVPSPRAILEHQIVADYGASLKALAAGIMASPARVMEGTAFHLWFFTALTVSLTWVVLAVRQGWQRLLVPIGAVLFAIGTIITLYHSVLDPWDIVSPDLARYFLLGPLFVAIGFGLERHGTSSRMGYGLVIAGLVGLALESAVYFAIQGHPPRHDFVISAIFLAVGAMIIGLTVTPSRWTVLIARLAPLTLGIYAIHILIREYLVMAYKFVPYDLFWNTFTAVLVFAVSLVVVAVMRQIPGLRRLVS